MRYVTGLQPVPNLRPCIVISANTSWNIVNFRTSLIKALDAAGYDIVIASPPDSYVRQVKVLGTYAPLPMDNKGTSPIADFKLFLRYVRLFRRLRPRAYLGYTIKPNVYGTLAARLFGVVCVNNVSGLGTAFIRDSWVTRVVKRLYRTAFSRTDHVFFQNMDDQKLFVEEGLAPADRTSVVPGSGVDIEHFRATPRPDRPADAPPVFLLIARMLWDKGIAEFVEAARIIRRHSPGVRFQLAGPLDVENRTAVDSAVVEGWVAEGVVRYLGALEDVRPAIADCDCVVLPSYREGAPRTLLEAAAMGRPVIATDVAGCRDVLQDGITGFLCHVRDSRDLARAMEQFTQMSDQQKTAMGEAGRKFVEQRYDDRLVIQEYLAVLRKLGVTPQPSQNARQG